MKIKQLLVFIFCLVLINLINNKLLVDRNKEYDVSGKVEKITIYTDKNLKVINKSVPINRAKIMITSGKVRHISHSEYIKINNIELSKIYIYSNKFGEFNVKLNPGEYTFFLVINDMAYLNSFDKGGHFTSTTINSKVDDLIITDFRGISF